ncbi:hypothetical protein [Dyadobacter fermentans]|uniref:Uncharacterized protein n=1 Tax=Dyadobacter fermentans (strain ATCC 700827 / DSM 18053 / CIP 107007 / KCTC 52180 / NS114) TaxID=471854 RepID=C6VUS2_DYAFD|nr:hypothetical protein [Dyadobacter fermentans]ACT93059.1 hypothetical protein Dfer_1820 [Dyadobacter fermentans DSM 18053]
MMNSPEEEADKELSRKLQQRFEGFKAPVNDRVRKNVFATLDDSSRLIYWIPRAGGMLLLFVFIIGYIMFDRKGDQGMLMKSKKISTNKISRINAETAYILGNDLGNSESNKDSLLQKSKTTFTLNPKKENSSKVLAQIAGANPEVDLKETPVSEYKSGKSYFDETDYATLSSIDSIHLNTSFANLAIPLLPIASNEIRKKPGILRGVKGIFSTSVLQTFQLVNLSQSTTEKIQNFRFAPLLSSRSLSYKVTVGLEKKHSRILLNYTYLRSWNEYEIGTNQVVASNIGGHQYQMHRIGKKHVEDDRSHLLGIGIQQKITMPKQILKGYSLNVGAEYTLVMPDRQSLVWGNVGFYRQIYQSPGVQLEIGPYGEYSFIQREVARQTWKYRPYQVGISLQVKLK